MSQKNIQPNLKITALTHLLSHYISYNVVIKHIRLMCDLMGYLIKMRRNFWIMLKVNGSLSCYVLNCCCFHF